MARYVDADKMREEWLENGENEFIYDTNAVLDSIDSQPTADVVEVKHGYWFDSYKGGSKKGCSVCYCQADLSKQGKEFCSHCGAKMDGGNENAD